jgi:AGCS family alanine or glycine:cation symporter
MKKSTAGLLAFAIIIVVLIVGGIDFFDSVWSFPGNFEFFKTFPTKDLPLGVIPLMIIVLVGTGIFVTIKLALPQIRYFWHGIKVTMGKYDNPEDEGDLNHFRALTTALSNWKYCRCSYSNLLRRTRCNFLDVDYSIFWYNTKVC